MRERDLKRLRVTKAIERQRMKEKKREREEENEKEKFEIERKIRLDE